LHEIKRMPAAEAAAEAMRRADEGLPKLWTIHRALCLRRMQPETFAAHSTYTPLQVSGSKQEHVIAYLRGDAVTTVAPRLLHQLGGEWGHTVLDLPSGNWTDKLTGASLAGGNVALSEVLRDFPVALLVKD
jgi:(1->4)-alpha-D-glucan 1-alpha-D-glucosylmutase